MQTYLVLNLNICLPTVPSWILAYFQTSWSPCNLKSIRVLFPNLFFWNHKPWINKNWCPATLVLEAVWLSRPPYTLWVPENQAPCCSFECSLSNQGRWAMPFVLHNLSNNLQDVWWGSSLPTNLWLTSACSDVVVLWLDPSWAGKRVPELLPPLALILGLYPLSVLHPGDTYETVLPSSPFWCGTPCLNFFPNPYPHSLILTLYCTQFKYSVWHPSSRLMLWFPHPHHRPSANSHVFQCPKLNSCVLSN